MRIQESQGQGRQGGRQKLTAEDLSERLLGFAVRAAKVAGALPHTHLGRHVAGQLIRSGTSPGSNYEEACAAESRADFAHKLGISLKELRESSFWLRFIVRAELLPEPKLHEILDECTQLSKIIGKSIATCRKKPRREQSQ